MLAVIYAFRSPGSGAVYIGKHQCCPEGWPRRGTGPLPDGYRGSGVAVANFHRRHGAAVQWRILATVAGGRDAVNAAERRAIRLARALLGRGCVNRLDGGDGLTSADAKRLWANPATKAKLSATLAANVRTPTGRAKLALAQKAALDAKSWQVGLEASRSPAAAERHREGLKAYGATPKGKAHLSRAAKISHERKRLRRWFVALWAVPRLRTSSATVWGFHPGSPITFAGGAR